MHDSSTGVERDVLTEIDRRQSIVKRMPEADVLERRALARSDRPSRKAVAGKAFLLELGGEDQQAPLRFDQVVGELRMHVERLVGRQRPRGRGPDHRIDWFFRNGLFAKCAPQLEEVLFKNLETDVYRGILPVLVLDFRLGERGAAVEAPVHR